MVRASRRYPRGKGNVHQESSVGALQGKRAVIEEILKEKMVVGGQDNVL